MPNGALTSAYMKVTYDAWNRPTKIEENGRNVLLTIEYDGLGRAIKRGVGSEATQFYYDTDWRVPEERSSADSTRLRDYVWGAQYIDELLCRRTYDSQNPTATHYFVQDANWNVITLLDSQGAVLERYRYDPYGKPTFLNPDGTDKTENIRNDTYLFQGRRRILWSTSNVSVETYHFRQRQYSTVLGRFLQRDPAVNETDQQLVVSYRFARNRPLQLTDPLGLWTPTEESKNLPRRVYVYEDGDTLESLADLLKLDTDDMDLWAKAVGKKKAPNGVPCKVSVPNTVFIEVGKMGFVPSIRLWWASLKITAKEMESQGYHVVFRYPTTKSDIIRDLRKDGIYVFMYAGHGHADKSGALIPDPTAGGVVRPARYTPYKIRNMVLYACYSLGPDKGLRRLLKDPAKSVWNLNVSSKGWVIGYWGLANALTPPSVVSGTTEPRGPAAKVALDRRK